MRRFVLTGMIALVGCFGPAEDDSHSSDTEYIPDDVPSGNCGETDNDPCTSSGAEPASGCLASLECDDGSVCAAIFDGDIGTFECRPSCIADFDETRWCIDNAGCCGVGSICQGRGYCVPAGATSSESGDVGDTDTGSDAGSSGAGSSDTGSSSTDSTGSIQ